MADGERKDDLQGSINKAFKEYIDSKRDTPPAEREGMPRRKKIPYYKSKQFIAGIIIFAAVIAFCLFATLVADSQMITVAAAVGALILLPVSIMMIYKSAMT